ncbi:polysaccharide lyase [Nocardiopsis sp. NPDC049922]|uniref:polysaccharide lyase n=1 Tax=Nocardiopsis sp. NPDC049922 TaxID=3155157 RepID=UPI0034105797
MTVAHALLASTLAATVLVTVVNTAPATADTSIAYRLNTFERATAGRPYPLSEWAKDGWHAPRGRGMDERTLVDDDVAHSGRHSLRVSYPAGRIGPRDSGAQAPFRLAPAREYHVSFWVRFSEDFSWGTTSFGGKLGLGLAGGAGCSGGRVCDGENGFSSRMIWRRDGLAAVYYYHMDKEGRFGDQAFLRVDDADVHYPRGEWVNIVQRLRVNTVTDGRANPDGEIEVLYNGAPAAEVTGLRLVSNDDLVDKAYFSSFFGGSTEGFAPADDSHIWYDDLRVSALPGDLCEIGGCV